MINKSIRNCSTCKFNNRLASKYCTIILNNSPLSFQIGLEFYMTIVGCSSYQIKEELIK